MRSSKLKRYLDKIIGSLLIVLIVSMVLNVTWQVVSRYVFQNPSSFTDELARYMLIWLGLLGAVYVAGQDKHLAIDILLNKLPMESKWILKIGIHLAVLGFVCLVMVLGGINLVYITYTLEQKSAALRWPLAWVYMIVPVSGWLIGIYQLIFINRCYSAWKTGKHGVD
ncbi:MAG: hypothetical protein RJA52_917 [Bacteroidota bacterium]|jgi:TRAP-type C4-dicarboxylate transport system permease small subunit